MPCNKTKSEESLALAKLGMMQLEPRPGGFVLLKDVTEGKCVCKNKKKSTESIKIKEPMSRASKINAATKELMVRSATTNMDWTTTGTEKEFQQIGIANLSEDNIQMLQIVISTTLLLASDLKVPCVHLEWTRYYLECIKDEYGNRPPNIQGILNHIRYVIGEREPQSCPSNASSKSSKSSQQGGNTQ